MRSIMMMRKLTATMSAPPTSIPPPRSGRSTTIRGKGGSRIGSPVAARRSIHASAPRPTINATARTGPAFTIHLRCDLPFSRFRGQFQVSRLHETSTAALMQEAAGRFQ